MEFLDFSGKQKKYILPRKKKPGNNVIVISSLWDCNFNVLL